MDLRDVTKNQHYISQAEQRLNAINPKAKKENQRIYSFSINSRDSNTVIAHLDSREGVKIKNNLSLNDLFSFDVLEDGEKYNFEKLFHKYETIIKDNTKRLLAKIALNNEDIKDEVIAIFISKFINAIRNPYSIKMILNTFSALKGIVPTNPIHRENLERVLQGSKPQQSYLCNHLSITESEYKEWLGIVFLLLTPMDEDRQLNLLEIIIKNIFENPNLYIGIHIYTFNNETCLLSDRGFNLSQSHYFDKKMVWEFNLSSKSFVRYSFKRFDLENLIPDTPNINWKEILDFCKLQPKSISYESKHNDLRELEQYNQNTVTYCHERVFNSQPNCYGIKVV